MLKACGWPSCRWAQDPWYNGPMVGYGADTQHSAGIPVDAWGVQPKLGRGTIGRGIEGAEYGVPLYGNFSPVNTYTYPERWSPNAQ